MNKKSEKQSLKKIKPISKKNVEKLALALKKNLSRRKASKQID